MPASRAISLRLARPEKATARSFGPTERLATQAWIEARQGDSNIYYSVNALKPTVRNQKARKEDLTAGLYLHVDVDDASALSRIREFPRRRQ
jgi:hypothetical protein